MKVPELKAEAKRLGHRGSHSHMRKSHEEASIDFPYRRLPKSYPS